MDTHTKRLSTGFSHVIGTIDVLPKRLRLASMDKAMVPSYTHTLLRALFFSHSASKFISYTETNDEISLIVDEETLELFPKDSIKVSEEFGRAFQFDLGSTPTETGSFVHGISRPLGRAGISIFFLTTFNSDLILVQESKFQEAKACLKANFPTSIVWDQEEPIDSNLLNRFMDMPPEDTKPNNIAPESFAQLQAFPDLSLCLTCIDPPHLEAAFKDLVQLLFFGQTSFRFISFTQTDNEVSLIMDERSLVTFPREKLEVILSDPWIPIKRLQKKGFSETGVVSSIAAPLSSLSMLYLSSFQTGHLLVKKEDFQLAVGKLQEKGFIVSTASP